MWKNSSSDSNDTDLPFYSITDLIRYISKKAKKNRFLDIKDDRFCFLESAKINENDPQKIIISCLFKSARNEFRPNIINKSTGEERANPKSRVEGDIEKTHFTIKVDKSSQEVFWFLEYNYHGIHHKTIMNYFTKFNKDFVKSKNEKVKYSIMYAVIPRDNFLGELKKLSRAKVAEVYFNKKLLGSEGLNFSNRYVGLRKDIKLTAIAETGDNIVSQAIDFFNLFSSSKNDDDISKIRVVGVDSEGNDVILDTSFMSRIEYVNIDINQETGEVNSIQLFTELEQIAESF